MRLRQMMKLRGETMRSMAEKIGTKHPTLVKWCSGKETPSGTSLVKLAYHLECVAVISGDGKVSFFDPIKIHIES